MERSHLSVGDDVAIWSAASSVPVDPYNDFVVPFIVRATVLDRSPAAGGVEVEVDGAPRHAASRAVICHWSDYLNRRALRAEQGSDARRQRRLDRETQALATAAARFPTARLSDGNVVIDVDDWLTNQSPADESALPRL